MTAKILSFPPLLHSMIAAVKQEGREIDRTILEGKNIP